MINIDDLFPIIETTKSPTKGMLFPMLNNGSQVYFERNNAQHLLTDTIVLNHFIVRFQKGFLLSSDETPAIEGPGHIEFWKHGFLKSVTYNNFSIEEKWINGLKNQTNYRE